MKSFGSNCCCHKIINLKFIKGGGMCNDYYGMKFTLIYDSLCFNIFLFKKTCYSFSCHNLTETLQPIHRSSSFIFYLFSSHLIFFFFLLFLCRKCILKNAEKIIERDIMTFYITIIHTASNKQEFYKNKKRF